MSKTHHDLKFGKEIKMLMVVDTSLQPLTKKTITGLHVCKNVVQHVSMPSLFIVGKGELVIVEEMTGDGDTVARH